MNDTRGILIGIMLGAIAGYLLFGWPRTRATLIIPGQIPDTTGME